MTKQERESMLYDEFDKFKSEPGESIHSYYLRYEKLINDMNMIPMSMSPMQINTKFVNHLKPKWSRFVTAAKQARNLHNVNFDQFYAPTVVQQSPTFQPDTGFVVPTFLPTNDPLASLNKAIIFLSSAYSSRYPPTNNQLRTSSNPITQATIKNGQVTIQNVQGVNQLRDKMLLAQEQEAGVVLNDEQQDFLADSLEENDECKDLQLQATTNFKADHVDPYDSDYDDKLQQMQSL
ncbi:hypothetical protein Tco_0760157 [Tanacetum coccineum]